MSSDQQPVTPAESAGAAEPAASPDTPVTESPALYPGPPDGYQRLWTPHRQVYIDSHQATTKEPVCPFCAAPSLPEADNLVVHQGKLAYAVLNLFPYNSGHLLICPYRHVADYTDLTVAETAEVAALTQQAMRVTRALSHPAGFNLGMNQGTTAGAGIAQHLHQHVVPRWSGDSNFFPIIAQTRALPQLLTDTRDRLRSAWSTAKFDVAG
ncbi:MAG: HIT domain-containing protein [Propionibacteriaceae bacterium]|jgi:ATP adenylyltransferase|nr:HIT domain-containing protein [Propionibacteriaceae bacterium]